MFRFFTEKGEKTVFYENELKLLIKTFQRSRVSASLVSVETGEFFQSEEELSPIARSVITRSVLTEEILTKIRENVIYKLKNSFHLSFLLFLLPGLRRRTLLILGPYAHVEPKEGEILSASEKNGLSPHAAQLFKEYCFGLPVVSESSALFVLLDTFCELIWRGEEFFTTEFNSTELFFSSPSSPTETGLDETDLHRRAVEERYRYENELLQAVARGETKKLARLSSGLTWQAFEMRTTDPLRNGKNYCIIMNTLLRKAAESGGVHPVQLDRTSSYFARIIEKIPATEHFSNLMEEMFSTYCRLVRHHSSANFSRPVQEAIALVDSDLSADLSLEGLARKIGVTREYLSSLFKKEAGKTVTEFIREKRMNYASFLLRTTDLMVQTVAHYCGIEDLQYFSKLFKKSFSLSPKEYRKKHQK